MNEPSITIVIPTRGRCETLYHTLKCCLAQDQRSYRVLVCDNCSEDATHQVIESFQSKIIDYVRTDRRLSMSQNWSFALKHVETDYVMYIGDDDGIVPNSLGRLARLVLDFPSKAYRLSNIVYYWGNENASSPLMDNACFNIVLDSEPKWVNAAETIAYVRDSLDYLGSNGFLKLPSLYHGLWHTDLVKNISKRLGGELFASNCPDMFSALAGGLNLERFVQYHLPVCVNGLSRSSNGVSARHVNKRKEKETLEIDHFMNEQPIPFSENLIKDPSMLTKHLCPLPVVVADQFYKARKIEAKLEVPTISCVLAKSMEFAINQSRTIEDFESYLFIIEHVASINDATNELQRLRAKFRYSPYRGEAIRSEKKSRFDYYVSNRTACIDTAAFGINNVFDMGRWLEKLVNEASADGFKSPRDAVCVTNLVRITRRFDACIKKLVGVG